MTPTHVPVQVIKDLKGSDYSWSYQTPPSSPSSSSSRKSSMCRSVGGEWGVRRVQGYPGREWGCSHKDRTKNYFRAQTSHNFCITQDFASAEGKCTPSTRLLLARACGSRSGGAGAASFTEP